jgi:hypothetical protein
LFEAGARRRPPTSGGDIGARAFSRYGGVSRNRSTPVTDSPPDRLCIDPASPHYDAAALERGVGVRFNGAEKTNVEEYCVSESWIRVAAGKAKDRRGNPITIKLKGAVEPYFRM